MIIYRMLYIFNWSCEWVKSSKFKTQRLEVSVIDILFNPGEAVNECKRQGRILNCSSHYWSWSHFRFGKFVLVSDFEEYVIAHVSTSCSGDVMQSVLGYLMSLGQVLYFPNNPKLADVSTLLFFHEHFPPQFSLVQIIAPIYTSTKACGRGTLLKVPIAHREKANLILHPAKSVTYIWCWCAW